MSQNKDDLIIQVFKEDNVCELENMLKNGFIDLNYTNKRKRNLIEQACLHASPECFSFLLNKDYFMSTANHIVPFIITKGDENINSQKTLDVFFSKKPRATQELIADFRHLTALDYF